jgi:hypothetical protein
MAPIWGRSRLPRRLTAFRALMILERLLAPGLKAAAITTSPATSCPGFCRGGLRTAAGGRLSTDDITGRVIATKGFDSGDAILRAAIREQVGSTVKQLHRDGTIKNIGAGRASKWKLAGA